MALHLISWFYLVTLGSLCAYLLFDTVTATILVAIGATAALLQQRHLSKKTDMAEWGTSRFACKVLAIYTPLDVFVNRVSRGSLWGEQGRAHISRLCVSSLGAKSGKPRIVPIMRYRINDLSGLNLHGDVVAATNNGGEKNPAWVHNFRAAEKNNDFVVYNKGGSVYKGAVYEVADPEARERFLIQMNKANPGFEEKQSRTTRRIPVFVLRPMGEWHWENAPDELIERLTPEVGAIGRALIVTADFF